MLDNLTIAQPQIDRIYILNSGTISLIEDLYRNDFKLDRSRIKTTISSLSYSGLINRLYYNIYDGNTKADNVVEFIAVPSGNELIEIADVKYRFVASLSGINNVPKKNTALGNAVALYRVINADGTAGTDFYTGQTANPCVFGILADNPLYIQSYASGIIGNTYSMYKDIESKAINVYNTHFTKGNQQLIRDPLFAGYISCSGNGIYYLPDVPSSDYGLSYYVNLYFATNSGLQALNSLQYPSEYWIYTAPFTGRTSLIYYAEVSGLIGADLVQEKIPSIGELVLRWDNMISHSGLNAKLAYPLGTGTPTQSTLFYNMTALGQKFQYIVFVFKSSAYSSPERSWPRPIDANGTWYYAGKTSSTDARVYVPIGSTYSFWVGFGNADTLRTSGLPIDTTHPNIYIE